MTGATRGDTDDVPAAGPGAPATLARRGALRVLAGAGLAAALASCGSSADDSTTTTAGADSSTTGASTTDGSGATTTSAAASTEGSCEEIPEETAGPFPGDGSNGPDVLSLDGVVRRDIRSSIGPASGTAQGVDLELELTLVDASGCAPLAGAALYAWHCDREGRYSMYSAGVTDQNYLRGVQVAGADGTLRFTTIFPGTYEGRWPHVHFEVYASVDDATGGGTPVATSQLAFPQVTCDEVYTADGYGQSVTNLARLSLERDMVFRDGVDQQMAAMTGTPGDGLTASLVVAV